MKISAVYKITNTATGNFYIGSSKDVKCRWASHKHPSSWNEQPNNPMYLDMRKYGLENFVFEVLEEVEENKLKEKEQYYIELLNPTYNRCNAKGLDTERYKESHRKAQKEYQKTDKGKESRKKANNKYNNQLCLYNGEYITLAALSMRFRSAGIPHPTIEAKKYLIKKEPKTPIEFYDIYP